MTWKTLTFCICAVLVTPLAHGGWNPIKDIERAFKDIKEETIEVVTGEDRGDLERQTRAQFGQARTALQATQNQTRSEFKVVLISLDNAIDKVRLMGIDPTRVRQENGSVTDLVQQRDEVAGQRDQILARLDGELDQLNQSEQDALRQIRDTFR